MHEPPGNGVKMDSLLMRQRRGARIQLVVLEANNNICRRANVSIHTAACKVKRNQKSAMESKRRMPNILPLTLVIELVEILRSD